MNCWDTLLALLLSVAWAAETGAVSHQDDEILDRYIEVAHSVNVLQDLNNTMIYHQGLNEQRLSRNYRGRTSPVTYAHQFMPQNRELQQLTSTNTFTNVLPKFLKTNDIRPTNHNERNWELHHNQYTIPGTPGLDYPTHTHIPLTTFYCYNQRHPGYYADQETNCQVFHVCDMDGRQDSFLCPHGTIFNQLLFVCDWWFNVDCKQASLFYDHNSFLYRPVQSKTSQ